MSDSGTLYTGLATTGVHQKLEAFFQIGVDRQRRIGTFIVLFSMIEQALEFALLNPEKGWPAGEIPPTDRMGVTDRLKALRQRSLDVPELSSIIELAVGIGEVLTEARHTVAHGAPIAPGRVERNRSWLGEARKRPFAALELSEDVLDAAATAGDALFRLLGAIGAAQAAHIDTARAMLPDQLQIEAAIAATDLIRRAMASSQRPDD